MKIVFLGTNGWYDTKTGNTTSTLIETDEDIIILDAGIGIYKAEKYLRRSKRTSIFLSHFHLDHIMGLHTLIKFGACEKISFYGPVGIKAALDTILDEPFSISISKLPFKTEIVELNEGIHQIPFDVTCLKLQHSTACFGYRFDLQKKVAYIADTGFCENAIKLSQGVDLIIAECSYLSGQSNPKWPHLTPEEAARIACEAKAKKLMLTHFDASIYPTIKKRLIAERSAQDIFKNSQAAFDNMCIEL